MDTNIVEQAKPNVIWQPLDGSQTLAVSCPCNHILYEGTRGPGKTDAQLMYFRRLVGIGYGHFWRGVIFDREYKNLDDLISKSKRWFRQFTDGARFIGSMSQLKWVWPTGEELFFRIMKTEKDYWGVHGHEFPFLGWNELTKHPTEDLYEMAMSLNRTSFIPELHSPINPKTKAIELLPEIPLVVFSTTNPYGIGHCVPYGEVLTTHGWVDIKEVNAGDMVLTVNKKMEYFYTYVGGIIKEYYNGEMIYRNGRGLNMAFTKNHRLPVKTNGTFKLKPFSELCGDPKIVRGGGFWKGNNPEYFTVPFINSKIRKLKLDQPFCIEWANYCELMGWFLSEGYTLDRDKEFGICQCKPENRLLIKELLDRCGFKYRISNTSFQISSKIWYEYLSQFGKSREKFVPEDILDSTKDNLFIFLKALMLGDGSVRNIKTLSGLYFTISKYLHDDVMEIGVKLGMRVFSSYRYRENRKGKHYTISLSENSPISLITKNNNINVNKKHYTGEVYCLNIPETETFFIRQNGCVWLSGNSWVKNKFIDVAPPGEVVYTTKEVFNPRTQEREEITKSQVRLFGSYKENIYLSPEYIVELESIRDPNKRRAWLWGDWDITSGGMFDDVWSSLYNIVEPFQIPPNWRIFRSFDWGSSKPFSVGWWAEANGDDVMLSDGRWKSTIKGDLFRIAEWYGWDGQANHGCKMLATQIAKGIIERELKMGFYGRVKPGPADSSINDVENGNCIAKDMAKKVIVNRKQYKGVKWTNSIKSPGSRKNGWEKMRIAIFNAQPDNGPRENPGLFVFRNCQDGFLRTVPGITRDPTDMDDVDTDAEDHVADEVRYVILAAGDRFSGGSTTGFF